MTVTHIYRMVLVALIVLGIGYLAFAPSYSAFPYFASFFVVIAALALTVQQVTSFVESRKN